MTEAHYAIALTHSKESRTIWPFLSNIADSSKYEIGLMQSITRSELISRLAARAGDIPYKDAEVSVSLILDAIADALARGDRVEIRGFGSFALNYRSPRNGRNPRTGEQVQVPAKNVPHFKAGKELRERVDIEGNVEEPI